MANQTPAITPQSQVQPPAPLAPTPPPQARWPSLAEQGEGAARLLYEQAQKKAPTMDVQPGQRPRQAPSMLSIGAKPPTTPEGLMPGAKPGVTTRNGLPSLNAGMYEPFIQRAAGTYTNVSAELIRAVAFVESSFKPEAKGKAYEGGKQAQGMMQLGPEVRKTYNVRRPFDAKENIEAGAHYLSDLGYRYGGDLRKMLSVYGGFGGNPDRADAKAYADKVFKYMGQAGTDPKKAASDPFGVQTATDKFTRAWAEYQRSPSDANKKAFMDAGTEYDQAMARAKQPGRRSNPADSTPVAPYDPLPSFWQQAVLSESSPAQRNAWLARWYPGSRVIKDERKFAPEPEFLLTADGKRYSVESGFTPGLVGGVPKMLGMGAAGALGGIAGFVGGGPPGAVAGAVAGGAAGGAGVQAMQEDIQRKWLGDVEKAKQNLAPGEDMLSPAQKRIATAAAWGAGGEATGPLLKLGGRGLSWTRKYFTSSSKEIGALQREIAEKGGSLPLAVATPGLRHFQWVEATANKLIGYSNSIAKRNLVALNDYFDKIMTKAGLPQSMRADVTQRLTSLRQFGTMELGQEIRDSLPLVPTETGEKVVRTGAVKGERVVKEATKKGEAETARVSKTTRTGPRTLVTETAKDVKPPGRAEVLFNQMRGMSADQIVQHVLRFGEEEDLKILNDTLAPQTMDKIRQAALRQTLLGALPSGFGKPVQAFLGRAKFGRDLGLRKSISKVMEKYTDGQRAILFPNGLDTDIEKVADVVDGMFPGVVADIGAAGIHVGGIQAKPLMQRLAPMAIAALNRWWMTHPSVVTRLADGLSSSDLKKTAAAQSVIRQFMRYVVTEAQRPDAESDPDSLYNQTEDIRKSLQQGQQRTGTGP